VNRARASRLAGGLGALAVAMVLGHLVTTSVGADREDPFVRTGSVGDEVGLDYADVTVTEVAPAKRLLGALSTSRAVQASDVFVVALVAFTPTTEPSRLFTLALVDEQDRVYRVSGKAGCTETVRSPTAVTTYAMLCFDVPSDRLAGMRLRLARGGIGNNTSRRDDVAEIDLGIAPGDVDDWAGTDADYRVLSSSVDPLTLEPADIVEDPGA
jgi:hypothetical protein